MQRSVFTILAVIFLSAANLTLAAAGPAVDPLAKEHLLVENDRRVRAVAQGTDGALYVLAESEANNQTDRHFPGEVIKITPQ